MSVAAATDPLSPPAGLRSPASVSDDAEEAGTPVPGNLVRARAVPKPWTEEIVRAADVVITMGCGDACPIYPGKRYADWDLEDPRGQGVQAGRFGMRSSGAASCWTSSPRADRDEDISDRDAAASTGRSLGAANEGAEALSAGARLGHSP